MPYHGIEIPEQTIGAFCRRHHIRRLSLFGSVLRDDFGADSTEEVGERLNNGKSEQCC